MRRPRAQKGAAKERRKKGAKKKVKRMKQPILKTMTLVALITMLLSLVAAVYGQDAENYGVPTTTTESSTRTAKTTDGAQGYVDLSSAMLFENLIIKDFVNSLQFGRRPFTILITGGQLDKSYVKAELSASDNTRVNLQTKAVGLKVLEKRNDVVLLELNPSLISQADRTLYLRIGKGVGPTLILHLTDRILRIKFIDVAKVGPKSGFYTLPVGTDAFTLSANEDKTVEVVDPQGDGSVLAMAGSADSDIVGSAIAFGSSTPIASQTLSLVALVALVGIVV